MKRLLLSAALTLIAAPVFAGVGVSVNIGEPGFYGQIELGDNYPPPQVVYQQPVIVDQVPESVGPPIYLRVPPGYSRDWRHHCGEYNACGHRVYFVQNNWYSNVYAPRYHQNHGGPGPGPGYRDDRGQEHGRGPDHGRGQGQGHGQGQGQGQDHDHGHDRDHRDH